jgi:cyclopropane fatty-acyl-phospholipid synthase-like methyltransferase
MREKYWDSDTLSDLFRLCVGKTYGDNPLEKLDEIRTVKNYEANNINELIGFTKDDVVADLGSGCGFIARYIAPKVKTLHCLDIDNNFLEYCKIETATSANVAHHLIKYADLSVLHDKQLTVIYSTALFIHFNLYDIYNYLAACYACLDTNGRVLFDFLDANRLNISSDLFKRHNQRYLEDCSNLFTNVYWNDPQMVKRVSEQIGFAIEAEKIDNAQYFLVLRKI